MKAGSANPSQPHLRTLLAALGCLVLAATAGAQNAPPLRAGFAPLEIPGQTAGQANAIGSQVVAADLGLSAGLKSIVFGLRNGKLYVVKNNGGNSWGVAPGWPQQLPAHIYSSPAVGDLNNDGQPDIVVGYGSTFDTGSNGGLKAFKRDGTLLWTVTTADVTPGPANGLSDPVMGTPAIGDVNGDGQVDVVFGALDHRLYVVNGATGASINSAVWPKDMQDTVFSTPALFDLDSDGKLDIIIGTDSYLDTGGRLRVLRYNGTEFAGFPKIIDQVVSSSPAVGDIDGDGKPEIIHGTGTFWTDANNGAFPAPLPRLYAWHCDGTPVSGWPVTLTGQVATSPALANLDGDPQPEIVVTDVFDPTPAFPNNGDSVYRVYGLQGNGSQMFSTVVRDFFGANLSAGEPIVADILGADSAPEILVPANGEVAVFDTAGSELTETDNFPDDPNKPNLMTQGSLAAVAVTDLETTGAGSSIDVIAVSAKNDTSLNQTITTVFVWTPLVSPNNRATTPLWGFFHQNERRTGVVPGTGPCAGACTAPASTARSFFTVTPCRLVDTRNAAGTYGGPALVAGALRDFDLAGAAIGSCPAIPATAAAISLNITVVGATNRGTLHMTQGCAPTIASVLSFNAGQTRANNTVLPLGASGQITVQAEIPGGGSVHLLIDVNGYFE